MKAKVIDLNNKAAGDIDLAEAVFGVPVRADLLARAVNYQRAKSQSGNHKTKGVSEIRGTTAKPFRQKGTGRARQGSAYAAQFRGGQTTFGPVVRSHAHDLPKKVRRLALKTALSSKQADGKLVVLDAATAAAPKTKALAAQFSKLGWEKALIIAGQEVDRNFDLASRNIVGIRVLPSQGANVLDILKCDTLVLTRDAVTQLQERLS